jgi:hypothetical protein
MVDLRIGGIALKRDVGKDDVRIRDGGECEKAKRSHLAWISKIVSSENVIYERAISDARGRVDAVLKREGELRELSANDLILATAAAIRNRRQKQRCTRPPLFPPPSRSLKR